MELFRVNIIDGTIDFKEAEFLIIPEFKAVMRKLRKVQGDLTGRYKKRNRQELLYIFCMADWTKKNVYHSLPEKERHYKAIETARLPQDYVPDEIVQDAIVKYEEIQQKMSPTTKILISLKRNMQQSSNYFEGLSSESATLMTAKTKLLSQLGEGEDATILEGISTINKLLQTNIVSAQKFTIQLESAIDKIDKLTEKAQFEMETAKRITGGGEVYNRELPKGNKTSNSQ